MTAALKATFGAAVRSAQKRSGREPTPLLIQPGFNGTIDRKRGCQWIENEPSADDMCKCGAPIIKGAPYPYCEVHFLRSVNLEATSASLDRNAAAICTNYARERSARARTARIRHTSLQRVK